MEPLQPAEFKHSLAIELALQHPALSTDPRILCTAAQACKAWQQALQQCSACNTVVVLGPAISLQQVSSFKRWLFRHPGLLRSLTAKVHDVRHQEHHLEAVLALLQQAMQQAAWTHAAAAAAAAAGVVTYQTDSKQQQQQQQPQQQQGLLRLASIHSNLPGAPAMLPALSSRHLTHLHLQLPFNSPADGPCLAVALPQLISLQQLHLEADHLMPGSIFAAISHLSRLTSLEVSAGFMGVQLQLQQALQRLLLLRVLRLRLAWEEATLDLSALTRLEDLTAVIQPRQTVLPQQLQRLHVINWKAVRDLSGLTQLQDLTAAVHCRHTVLPPQLQSLPVTYCAEGDPLAGVMPLRQLRRLQFEVEFEEPQLLLRLTQLPGLTQLHLTYSEVQFAAGTAAAWAQLPQLQALDVSWGDDDEEDLPDEEEMAVIWAGALACTGLTRLCLSAQNHQDEPDSVAVCSQLARLTGLLELTISSKTSLVPGDAQALTALTALTRLSLSNVLGMEDADIVVLANGLPQLRHFELAGLDFEGMSAMAAVGQLTHLTQLCLTNTDGLTDQSLMQLSGLVQLQVLGEPPHWGGIAAEGVDRLWAAVRRQRLHL